jgi:hypothetical protein
VASRTRKRTPYDPSKAHDRRATESNRGIANHLTPKEVDDPFEQGAKIIVMRNLRNDPLAGLHARGSVDEAQYHAGRAFQHDFETAERGPCAIDPSKEFVDGGKPPEPITDAQQKAVKRLNRAERELGQLGSALTHGVLIKGCTIWTFTAAQGRGTEAELKYYGKRFRECLDSLALVYGFAMEKGK